MIVNALSQVECKIENLAVEVLPCNAQQKFAVVINFTPVNPAADKFKVQGNGINHGTFSHADLPITIDGLPGNCTTPYEFVIRDWKNLNAVRFIIWKNMLYHKQL